MTLVLDDERRVLLMYRHRFVIDAWERKIIGAATVVAICRALTSEP